MMLPTEILDIVFSQVHLKTAAPTPDSQATFSSLCLSSKHFLPLAREFLYYRPLDLDKRITWKKAFSFIEALAGKDCLFGALVAELQGLVHWIVKLGDLDDPPAVWFSISGCTKTFSWYLTVLKSCTRLTSVDLLFSNDRHKAMVLNALKPSLASLKRISLVNHPDSDYRLDSTMVRAACRHSSMQGIEDLKLVNIDFLHITPATSRFYFTAQLPLPVRFLHLVSSNLSNIPYLLPVNSSNLRSFVLEYNHSDFTKLSAILGLLPTSLETLSVSNGRFSDLQPPQLHRYLEPGPYFQSIPLLSLASFPHLSNLTLKGLTSSIIRLVDSLSPSSQSLSAINLQYSKWARSSDSEEIFPENDILQSITTFPKLEYLHLGYLPTITNEKYQGFESTLNGLGIKVEWDKCLPHQNCICIGTRHASTCYFGRQ